MHKTSMMMKRQIIRRKSKNLGKFMSVRKFGDAGLPVIAFPTQDGMSNQWEDFGMIETLAPFIESGRITVYCVDTVDVETWSARIADKNLRAERQEAYFRYITEELAPNIGENILLTGCSCGGMHSAVCLLRRPDLFSGMVALSGAYDARHFVKGYLSKIWRWNSGVDILKVMPDDDPRLEMLRHRSIVCCVGQGLYEDIEVDATRKLEQDFKDKHIDAWVDYWGSDVSHDWMWWKAQLLYFLPYALDEIESRI